MNRRNKRNKSAVTPRGIVDAAGKADMSIIPAKASALGRGRSVDAVWNHDRILALLIALLGVYIAYESAYVLGLGSIHNPDSGFMPFYIGLSFIILGGLWAFKSRSAGSEAESFIEKNKLLQPALAVAVMLYYAATFKGLGYVTATLTFVAFWEKLIERQNWTNTFLIAVLSTVGMYLLFGILLEAPLPRELLFG
jgi:hypothetical protein